MNGILLSIIGASVAFVLYAYIGYPLVLKILAAFRPRPRSPEHPSQWPRISITVPAHNEEATIRSTVESLLRLDYPVDRRQILVVSDASTDRTDEIVSEYAHLGVELFRLNQRVGKTAAENAVRAQLTGDIIVNTDASVRIHPQAIKRLVTMFQDPTVGVASGRDVSVDASEFSSNIGEKGYVGYEMWVRSLETRVATIVQASGCLYAARHEIHDTDLREFVTRDYASVAIAWEHGYRAVSVDDAVCFVPRTRSLRAEYRRKVRTITRGLESVAHKRHLLNPFRYGVLSWMVFSHKLCRWLVPWTLAAGAMALVLLGAVEPWARWLLIAGAGGGALAAIGWLWPEKRETPRPFAIPAYIVAANLAALHGCVNLLRGETNPAWSPTRRETVQAPE